MHRPRDMESKRREDVEDLIEEMVYARVLVALEREQLRRRDESLRARLDALLGEIPRRERRRLCERALERAWERAERDARAGAGEEERGTQKAAGSDGLAA